MLPKVTCVIPTIGRADFPRAIRSALQQSYPIHEVILVDGSQDGISTANIPKDRRIKVVRRLPDSDLGSRWTAASNRNFGISLSTGEYMALLDDDDEWYINKTEIQMHAMQAQAATVASSRVNYRLKKGVKFPRPFTILRKDESILEVLYGRRRLLPLSHYLATPSIVVEASLARSCPINENLLGFEDTWWLHELQEAGASIVQVPQQLLTVHAEPLRSIGRDSVERNFSWAEMLATVNPLFAENYLSGICLRNAILKRRFSQVSQLKKRSRSYSQDAKKL